MIVLNVLRCRQCHVKMGGDDEIVLSYFVCWVIVWLSLYFGTIEMIFIFISIFV